MSLQKETKWRAIRNIPPPFAGISSRLPSPVCHAVSAAHLSLEWAGFCAQIRGLLQGGGLRIVGGGPCKNIFLLTQQHGFCLWRAGQTYTGDKLQINLVQFAQKCTVVP